jgi:3-dehydro-4-phosphotetronate decarboxylase
MHIAPGLKSRRRRICPSSLHRRLRSCLWRGNSDTGAAGIVHLHSTYSVAVSCLCHDNAHDILPPITAYYVMRIGRLPLLPYFRPGDMELADAVREAARGSHAMLLANHGPVVAGTSLDDAVHNAEELEETARLFLMLKGHKTRFLTEEQIAALREAFPS